MIYEKVVEYITQQLPVKASDVKPESRLVEDLGADSANMMMLIMDLEAEYDMTGLDKRWNACRKSWAIASATARCWPRR